MIPFVRKLSATFLAMTILYSLVCPVWAVESIGEEITEAVMAEGEEATTENWASGEVAAEQTESIEEEIPEEPIEARASEEDAPEQQCETEISTIHDVPVYFQTDYPDTLYGDGTVKTNGCSITSVAMVASYMTGHSYLPNELAVWFGSFGYNNMERLEYASDMLCLPYRKATDIQETLDELKKGNIAIALMNKNSQFTDTQHFIVLRGITEEGRILVNDPYAPNYESQKLKAGFEKGFSFYEIVEGYSGAWIYDVHEMPDDPYIYRSDKQQAFVKHWEQMPVYYQNDYPNDRFGAGTIATSGCAITSLAMVASYMTQHEYLPNTLAKWFGGHGANNVERLEYASDMLRLPYWKAQNVHEVLDEVRSGSVAILLMNSKSIFTSSQHFIVITGVNQNGRFMVSDSYKPNYQKQKLKNGFQNGFTADELTKGFDGGWIYDVNSMPEEPFIYVEDKPYVEPRYPDISLTYEEQQLLAKVIWVEARGESAEGQQAIAEIVFNRMVSDDFPDTLAGVIYAENQFRSVKFLDEAEPWQAQYDAIDDALEGPYVLPINVFHFATYAVNENVWGQIGGHIFCYQCME